jgi:glycosyltransferase involved in cell wall biosynthesis
MQLNRRSAERRENAVKASIVIRSKNEARFIGEVLRSVFAQVLHEPFEVILLDSGSRDDTVKIASGFPVAIHLMDPREFTFGRALNRGAQIAKGECVVFLSAHCTPVDDQWLDRLLRPLDEDSTVVATYGRQEPRKGLNPIEEMHLKWIFPSDGSREPSVVFSSANCAIRREILLRLPFDESCPWAEDYIWRKLLPPQSHAVYIAGASVYHSHPLDLRYWAGRFRREGELIPYLSKTYAMEYYGESSAAPLSGLIRWSSLMARQEVRYCWENGYVPYLPLVPVFEALRVFFFWRGLGTAKGRMTPR